MDDGGEITHWNEAHTEMTGIAESEALGSNAHDLLGTKGTDETLAEEVKSLAEESQEHAERVERLVGEVRSRSDAVDDLLAATAGDVEAAADRVESVDAVFADITEAVSETADGASQVAAATDDHARSSDEVAEMVETAAGEIEALEDRLSTAAEAASHGRRRVRQVESSVSDLGEL